MVTSTAWVTHALALVALLIVASAARADCAWLLWSTYQTKTGAEFRTEHAIKRAFESQRGCEQAAPDEVRSVISTLRGMYKEVNVSRTDSLLVVAKSGVAPLSDNDALLMRVSCWPLGLKPAAILGGAEYPMQGGR